MRKIEWTSTFKRDFKREKKKDGKLESFLHPIFVKLATGETLEERYHDHALTGNYKRYRDCHIKPDLILIYEKPDDEILRLVRLGSHSELNL